MKRASLSPAPARPKREAPDLTDRLLAREGSPTAQGPSASAAKKAGPKPKRGASKRARRSKAAPPEAALPETAGSTSPGEPLEHALAQSQAAISALQQAAQAAPARYEVALRYRLDALAHHLRQVADFVSALARPDRAHKQE